MIKTKCDDKMCISDPFERSIKNQNEHLNMSPKRFSTGDRLVFGSLRRPVGSSVAPPRKGGEIRWVVLGTTAGRPAG